MPSDLINGSYRFEVGDRAYELQAQISRELERKFEAFAYERAMDELIVSRRLHTPEEFKKERESLKKGYRLGLYSMRQPRGSKVLASLPGIVFLTRELLGEDATDDDVMALSGEYPEKIQEIIQGIIEDSFEQTITLAKKKMADGTMPKPTTAKERNARRREKKRLKMESQTKTNSATASGSNDMKTPS